MPWHELRLVGDSENPTVLAEGCEQNTILRRSDSSPAVPKQRRERLARVEVFLDDPTDGPGPPTLTRFLCIY